MSPLLFTARRGSVLRTDDDQPLTLAEAREAADRWAKRTVAHHIAGRKDMARIAASIAVELCDAIREAQEQQPKELAA